MPELLTDEQQQLATRARRFADDVLAAVDPADTSARSRVIDAAKEAGLFTLSQPVSHGGIGASILDLVVARDALMSRNPPLASAVFGPGPGVLSGCSDELVQAYLAPLLAGEKRGGFAFTEPDDAPHHTKAVRDGDVYRVTGAKSYVTGGGNADFLNTLVEIEGEGKAMLVIDTGSTGVQIARRFASLDGSQHAGFTFDNVAVPVSHRLGDVGAGLKRAMGQIGDTRLLIAADCVGLARWVADYCGEHLRAPHRSGKNLGDREGVRLRFGEMRADIYTARAALYRAARHAVSGSNAVNEVSIAKYQATEMIARVVDKAIQLVGGNALITEHPLARLYQSVRSWRLAEGASDVLLLNIARGALDLDKGTL
ncbi:MAG: acyl-CoA/acyl-ACP dehydrogenase [Pseudomonadaceae bacterium]|nr:acyl-CoA/acyl-ACP dehydrogenase [Pseudomonadaceae bacterium]